MKEKKEKTQKLPKEKKVKENKIDFDDEPVEKGRKMKAPKVEKQKSPEKREKVTAKYFKKFSGRSLDTYDEMVQADYAKAIERAHQLSNIQKYDYSAPVLITVPDAFRHGDRVNYRLDQKSDGTYSLMYDQALVYVLFFGKTSLFYYQANVDHRNGHITADVAGEFHYSDVIHMETVLKYDNVDKPKYITLDLEIGLVDSIIIPFHLRNHRIHQAYHLPTLLTDKESQILGILKKKVRESRSL
ncbi:MAG: hypothetical protein KKG64_05135 [Firmicutes bacterium]|nr:hypothetical protein [Bacillota bacterium]